MLSPFPTEDALDGHLNLGSPDWHPTVLTITQSHIHFSNQNNPLGEKMRCKILVNLI